MKKALILGSTVLDIIIEVPKLPKTQEDVHIIEQSMSLGGCAFNVRHILSLFSIPNVFCSPVGTGIYGDYVAAALNQRGLEPFVRLQHQDNGCCYCYVEPSGERTFISYHGAEYTFDAQWLEHLDLTEFEYVYLCGLELEEPTGHEMLSFLKSHPHLKLYFAPGPRFNDIGATKLDTLWTLNPVVHLSMAELLHFTGERSCLKGAEALFEKTQNMLIITDGANGAYAYDGETLHFTGAFKADVVDTIGAGDAHIGTFIACQMRGDNLETSLSTANLVAAKVVGIKGSLLEAL